VSASTSVSSGNSERAGLESLLSFWADAGVDTLYAAEPVDRTRRIEAKASAASPTLALTTPSVARLPAIDLDAPRRVAEAASDLDSLRAGAADYLLQVLGIRAPVFWRGAADAAVFVIGEAPGLDDENAGLPFAAAAGRLLDRMLAAIGMSDRAMAANTLFWRPPGDRPATPDEQAICAVFLERAIALVKPRALLITGAGAAKAMLGRDEPILSLHGRWLEWRSADGALEIPALPTLSPAFLLRQPAAKAKSWSDLVTLSERVDRPHRPE